MSGYGNRDYPYLEGEDIAFSQCFRLSESEFLSMCGGLKTYTQHRLDRTRARDASIKASGETMTFSVPRLPSDIEQAMSMIQLPGIKEEKFAEYLLSEQISKVAGVMSAVKADKQIKASLAREAEQKQGERKIALARLRQEAANRFGWEPDSQSAADWATAEYARQQRDLQQRRGY